MISSDMTRTTDKGKQAAPFRLRPGFIVANEFSAVGGSSYRSERVKTQGNEHERRVVRKVDNAELYKESRAILGAAYYAMVTLCTNTPIGYFAAEDKLPELRKEVDAIKEAAEHFNYVSERRGSERRVTIEIYPLKMEPTPTLVKRLQREVFERLGALYLALRNGDRKGYEAARDRASNLEQLVVGSNEEIVRAALGAARDRKHEMLELIRGGDSPEGAGKKLHLETLERALQIFGRGQ